MFWGALSAVKILNAVLGFSKSTAMYLLWITSPFLLKGWVEQKRPSTPESQVPYLDRHAAALAPSAARLVRHPPPHIARSSRRIRWI